jgi:predicted O-methyltransferase YrrM
MKPLPELYLDACHTPSDIFEHLPVFVDLCRELKATKVIELGTRGGVSTIAWLYGLDHQGHLWSVDINPGPLLDYEHWTFLRGHDLDPVVLAELPEKVDAIFIDTSHHYEDTLRELETYLPRVREGGRLVLHDTELEVPEDSPAGDPPYPVKTAVEYFCELHDLEWSNVTNCYGLAQIVA